MDDNQVHIFRLRISRNVFTPVVEQKNKGRRREYGNKLKLKNTSGWPKEDAPYSFEFTSAKGQLYTVKLKRWNDLLIRGTREFHSANHPIDVIQADVQDADGNSIYKRPLWIGIPKSNATLLVNHVPANARLFGASEHESRFIFDLVYNNETERYSLILCRQIALAAILLILRCYILLSDNLPRALR